MVRFTWRDSVEAFVWFDRMSVCDVCVCERVQVTLDRPFACHTAKSPIELSIRIRCTRFSLHNWLPLLLVVCSAVFILLNKEIN